MQQDNNNIENRSRQLENQQLPDLSRMDTHWQQMQAMLQPSSYTVKRNLYSRPIASRVLAGLLVLAAVAFLLRYGKDQNKKTVRVEPPKVNNNKMPVPGNSDAVINTTDSSYTNYPKPPQNISDHSLKKPPALIAVTRTNDESFGNSVLIKQDSITDPLTIEMNQDEKDGQLLHQFFNTIEKPSQQFLINNYKDTSLVCTEGTRIFIPANVFVNTNNTVVNDAITITIKEFYSYQDIISNKLSTTSDGGQLVSGGMLYIAAMQNGKELRLADTKKMTIKMPTSDYDEQMQLFTNERQMTRPITTNTDFAYDYTSNDNINWQPAGQFQRLQRTKFYVKMFDPYGQPYESWETKNGTTVGKFIIRRNCPMSNKDVLAGLWGHFGLFYNKIKLRRSWSNHPGPLFSKGEWPVVGDSIMIEYNMAKQLKLISKSDIEKYEKQLLQDSTAWNERVKKIPFYEFQISKLGFMNCDRFQNDQSPKVEFTLNLGEGENANNFFSVLAFDKYRSVMQGYSGKNKLMFSRIPENANVHLICVGVKNGKVLSCIKPLRVGTEEVSGLQFEETTAENFKNQIAALHLK